jgi:hypothetical protein
MRHYKKTEANLLLILRQPFSDSDSHAGGNGQSGATCVSVISDIMKTSLMCSRQSTILHLSPPTLNRIGFSPLLPAGFFLPAASA